MTAPAQSQRSDSVWTKILHFPLTRIVLAALAVLIAASLAEGIVVALGGALALKTRPLTAIIYYALFMILTVLAVTQSYRVYVRWVEERAVSELGTNGAWREGGTGALFGMALIAATVAILAIFGLYHFTGVTGGTDGVMGVVMSLANDITGAFVEELLLRAIVFRIAEEVVGSWWAILISAILFTGLHPLNTESAALNALLIGVEATLLLCGAWMLTRRLWLAVGIHAGWDFAQGGLFGVATAGQGQAPGLLQGQLTGTPLLTGGAAGIEASIIAFVVVLAASIYLLMRAHQRGSILPPSWQLSKPPQESEGAA